MLFNSAAFLIFFPTVVLLYFGTPPKARWVLLLAASYLFYAWWNVAYLGLIILSTVIDYCAGLGLGRLQGRRARRVLLWLSLGANLGLLGFFKYWNFFADSAAGIMHAFGVTYTPFTWEVLLPVGISFYTFQSMSYSIDVYRRVREPEPHAGMFALYVAFFPQLVAGPIERSTHLLPQLRETHRFDYSRAVSGLRLMLWGYFLKLTIADRLGPYVDVVYGAPETHTGLPLVIATYFFGFQIFADFAGYSFIAIGAARIMGYSLMENFRRPFLAPSVSHFWREWHISLSTWFRDYVYLPLGGNKVGPIRRYANLFAVFAISGLWHGASWTMVLWGCLHGLYVVVETALGLHRPPGRISSGRDALVRVFRVLVGFHLVWLGWVLFRSDTLAMAMGVYADMFDVFRQPDPVFVATGTATSFVVSVLLVGGVMGLQLIQGDQPFDTFYDGLPKLWRWLLTLSLVFLTLLFGSFVSDQFIYFQF